MDNKNVIYSVMNCEMKTMWYLSNSWCTHAWRHTYVTRNVQAKPSTTFSDTTERTVTQVKATENFNNCHRACQLKALQTGDQVWIPEFQQQATVLCEGALHSYLVHTLRGRTRRNQQQLTLLNTTDNIPSNESDSLIPNKSRRHISPYTTWSYHHKKWTCVKTSRQTNL